MIYQLQIYYGAVLNGKTVYSLESSFTDCTKPFNGIKEDIFRKPIEDAILKDGFNPDDFEIGYLTKEQYENRFSVEEKTTTIKIEK